MTWILSELTFKKRKEKKKGYLKPVLCENLEGWDGEGGGGGVQVGGDTCIPMANVWQNHHNVVIILQLKKNLPALLGSTSGKR